MECSNTWLFSQKKLSLATTSMAFFRYWYAHLACLVALNILLFLANLYIFTMGGWHYYCVSSWIGNDCGVSCIVGLIGMIGCGCQFFCFTQMVFEMSLHHFRGTFKWVIMQFVSATPFACYDDYYRAQLYISAFILALFVLVLISKHLMVFV